MMKSLRAMFAVIVLLSMIVATPIFASGSYAANNPVDPAPQDIGAIERGYRTGYSDGYMAGYRDMIDRAQRDFRNKEDYYRADRAYVGAYGELEDYRDGYQQGFEVGYDAGFDKRGFNSNVPSGLSRRGVVNPDANAGIANSSSADPSNSGSSGSGRISSAREVSIAPDTIMLVELLTALSTESSQQGDRFQVRVMEPIELEGAVIEGRVSLVRRPGRVKGTGEMQLAFEQIKLTDGRTGDVSALVIEVVETGDNGVGGIDAEGGVKGKASTKDDAAKVGAASGIGAIIGAIAGGGKGAAIGAAVGAAAGTGSVVATRGKEIRLPRGQQLKIRTSGESRIP